MKRRHRLSAILSSIRSNFSHLLLWPLVCLVFGVALWGTTFAKLQSEKSELQQQGFKDAASLANGYARQLNRNVQQIDQMTLQVQYDWLLSKGQLRLENLVKTGLFPSTTLLRVNIANRRGRLVTATIPITKTVMVNDREYFLFHKQNNSNVLRVGTPVVGRVLGTNIVQFSRRLNAPDGSFDGVVIVSAEIPYFLSFYESASLGKRGLLAVVGDDGHLRASGIGGSVRDFKPATRHVLQQLLAAPGPVKESSLDADKTSPFLVAGSHLKSYPLAAVVGLSEDEILEPYRKSSNTYKNFAIAGTAVLFLFALVSTLQSLRFIRIRHESEKARAMYGITLEGGSEGFLMWRAVYDGKKQIADFVIVDANERAAGIYGVGKEKLVGKRLSSFYEPTYFEKLMKTYRQAMEDGYYEDDYPVPPESPLKMVWLHRKMTRTSLGLALVLKDISEAKAYEQQLLHRANHDALTSLPNRQWLEEALPATLQRAAASEFGVAVLFIDLDGFKRVNDTLGHSAGDALLRAAAHRLQSVLRPTDCVVRFGGDEFVVVLEPVLRNTKPTRVADRIVEAFNPPLEIHAERQSVGVSIGIAVFPDDGGDSETLLRNADAAMYVVKSEGKNGYRFYQPQLGEDIKKRISSENALTEALEKKQFILFYQPQVNTATRELCGMEALVRWQHPDKGLIPPSEFIPLAEATGRIVALGTQVIEQACEQLALWRKQGIRLVPISVNVSAQQFNQNVVVHTIAACLERYDVAPELLEIEITESSMLAKHAEIESQLAELRKMRVKLAIDDFGTGYSSLSQLLRLQMDVLKIDQSFIAQLGNGSPGLVFVKSIISLAHSLNMTVIAEGVENDEQLRLLQDLSCDQIQGYLISRPVPAQEITAMLQKH
ncbi:hypothetical protein TSA66_03450 [Noviherbaspirillum autotrophicum]|uniref:Diguanylate cyclase n=2 Tax=Noviherbaspirillum autotrophicum TaxID=709839 RepID=A0A0C1YRY7_9BURK|nr:hypothetical protein TSA66_03450 [Noviherbaspirillum autotrophicum]